MSDAIDNYRPRRRNDWHVDREFVTAAVRAAEPHVAYEARILMSDVAAHVRWCRVVAGLPQTIEVVFAKRTIEEYIARGCPTLAPVSKGNRRSALRRVAEVLLPDIWKPERKLPYTASRAPAPYSQRDVTVLRSWASSRPTDEQRRNAVALLALGLGCGLAPEDINPLQGRQVTIGDAGVSVQVEGRRARTVTCLATWEADLAAIVESVRHDDFVFRRNRPGSRAGSNYLSHFVDRTTPDGQVKLNGQRARVTWIVHHLTVGTPLPVVLGASGVRTVDAFERYLHLVPSPDANTAAQLLRGRPAP